MDPEAKSQHYFGKGINSFLNGNYDEALNLFIQSQTYKDSKDTQDYIQKCKDKLTAKSQSNGDEPQQQQAQQEEQQQPRTETSAEDDECKSIINSHDYYQILDLSKDCSSDDIKKAYKKKAMRFHPDKNSSKHAEEAFKKISTAYQTLSDPNKRKTFDKYGSEEKFREHYYQEHKRQYEDEFDPFDLFQMFMNGGLDRATMERLRRQRGNNAASSGAQNSKLAKLYLVIQLLPMVMMMVYYFLPQFLEKKDLFLYGTDLATPEITARSSYRPKVHVKDSEDIANYLHSTLPNLSFEETRALLNSKAENTEGFLDDITLH